ncbi:hypothetical protein LTR73_009383, partial [Friedmanniomyces endolithicus]
HLLPSRPQFSEPAGGSNEVVHEIVRELQDALFDFGSEEGGGGGGGDGGGGGVVGGG